MVEGLLGRYTNWKECKEKGVDPAIKKKKKPGRKGKGKPERTNKSKNGFKYKLKLDYIPIKGIQGAKGQKMVRKILPGVVNSKTLARKLDRLELKLRPLRPLEVILAQSVKVSPHQQ